MCLQSKQTNLAGITGGKVRRKAEFKNRLVSMFIQRQKLKNAGPTAIRLTGFSPETMLNT